MKLIAKMESNGMEEDRKLPHEAEASIAHGCQRKVGEVLTPNLIL